MYQLYKTFVDSPCIKNFIEVKYGNNVVYKIY